MQMQNAKMQNAKKCKYPVREVYLQQKPQYFQLIR